MGRSRILGVAAIVFLAAGACLADGMIVPTRPEIRVRGSWAVKYHHVDVKVRDQVAFVSIDQEFLNTGQRPIEVEYHFPVPPDAAIDSMTFLVNGKEFQGRLLKADEARQTYEQIVRRKKDPALLEYAGSGVYRTKAFPLQPNKPARVVVTYKNRCRKDRNVVEVWYPLNTEKFSAKPLEDVKVSVDIKSRADIGPVYSPTHDVAIERDADDPTRVTAVYHETDTLPTTDFQVFYTTDNQKVGATLLTHQGEADEDGYFLLLVSPNPRASDRDVLPKDLVIMLDRSGSMAGEKMRQAVESVRFILRHLNPEDRFNVIAYHHAVDAFSEELMPADRRHVEKVVDGLDRLQPSGGTNIDSALQKALKSIGGGRGERPKYVLFLTDGKPTIGNTYEKTVLKRAREANGGDAKVFALGVGYDVNVRLLDRLAGDHRGWSGYLKPSEDIEARVASLYNKIKNPVMTDLSVRIEGLKLRDTYPPALRDLFDGEQLVLAGRFRREDRAGLDVRADGLHTRLVVTGRYRGGKRTFEYPVTVRPPGRDLRFAFVEKLWAMRRVGYLLDQIQLHGEEQEVVEDIVRLSREYGIMTPYTSFLADEDTPLQDAEAQARRFRHEDGGLAAPVTGKAGQRHAVNRQKLNEAKRPGGAAGSDDGVSLLGSSSDEAYEEDRTETIRTVRRVGNTTLYLRQRTWMTPEAARKADKDKVPVREIERFSDEYFGLVRQNTIEQNQVLASQKEDEELLIYLRGTLYRIR